MKKPYSRFNTAAASLFAIAAALTTQSAIAVEIGFRSFSGSAAIGPPADAYAAKLLDVTTTALGAGNEVKFRRLSPTPGVPAQFGGSIMAAVAAGTAGGGFNAAYISGSDLNAAWGFLFNSGAPFGPTFDEYMGFLYGKSINGSQSGLDLLQSILDRNNRNVVAVPIVGSTEQGSGYFPLPVGKAPGTDGIGLKGLCQQFWTFRYLPPAQDVLNRACNNLVASGAIRANNISFIAAVPGGGSLVDGLAAGTLHALEFATPLDDVSQLFNIAGRNPGTFGVRYLHFPGWHQQYLITHMIINKQVWEGLSAAQQTLVKTVARDHVVSSYGDLLRQQGPALRFILDVNRADADPNNDMVLVNWPTKDLERLRDATIQFMNERASDPRFGQTDRDDYAFVLESMRKYVRANDHYWDVRQVPTQLRFEGWKNGLGEGWAEKGKKKSHDDD